ncbi:ADAM-TS Spacer 1 [Halocaridina rubra]|uniref:ADAM-TS Spacer 1 n=1 Tax=Halocaridina rubra TaxID=373956 RepID=A0AAN8WY98_HALRR
MAEKKPTRHGKCISVGCDKVISSPKTRDQCGVCGGDGGTCTHHNEVYHAVPPLDYSVVAIIPVGARNILVLEENATMNFLAIANNSSKIFLNGERTQEPAKTFIIEGAKFAYSNEGEKEMLKAVGPLLQPLSVMIHGSPAQETVLVSTSFYTPVQEEYYQWEIGPFTACSATCGGGEKHETLVCRDRRTDIQVFHDQCRHLPRPRLNTTRCNTFG